MRSSPRAVLNRLAFAASGRRGGGVFRRVALALAATAALAGCTTDRAFPVATETIDDSYRFFVIRWQTSDVLTGVAIRLKPGPQGTQICGAYGSDGNSVYRPEIAGQVFDGGTVKHGNRAILISLHGLAGPFDDLRFRGREANCLQTPVPWRPEFVIKESIRLDPPRVLIE